MNRRAGGRGARVPIEDRVRVLAYGADVPGGRGGDARGIVPIPLDDIDNERVLSIPAGKDAA
jgi:hypothetical protein